MILDLKVLRLERSRILLTQPSDHLLVMLGDRGVIFGHVHLLIYGRESSMPQSDTEGQLHHKEWIMDVKKHIIQQTFYLLVHALLVSDLQYGSKSLDANPEFCL